MKIERKAATLILAYYQVKDSDPSAKDYLQRLDMMVKICLQRFQNHLEHDDNPVATMFHVMVRMDELVLALDSIGAMEGAHKLTEVYEKIDADMRAVVTKLTDIDITNTHSIDHDFLDQFDPGSADVYSFELYRNKNPRNK